MRIALDLRPALRSPTGVGIYMRNLAHALASRAEGDEFVLFTASLRDRPEKSLYPPEGTFEALHLKIPVKALNFFWHRLNFPPAERFLGPLDLIHAAHPLHIPTRKARCVVTVHDLFFLDHPELTHAEIRRDYSTLLRPSLEKADAIVCVSQHTADQVIERFPRTEARIQVIPHGTRDFFRSPPSSSEVAAVRESLGAHDPFVLCVATLEPRKNLARLVRAFRRARKSIGEHITLVLVGAEGWQTTELEKEIRLADPGEIITPGYLDETRLRVLYYECLFLALPSLCEGFGLPVIEAMAAGKPVLVSRGTALPEVAGEAAVLVDPNREEDIERGITHLLKHEEERSRLGLAATKRSANYTWDRTALQTHELYRKLD